MRVLFYCVTVAVSFLLGVGVERHRSGDETSTIGGEMRVLEAKVDLLTFRCWELEKEATELRMRTQTLLPNIDL